MNWNNLHEVTAENEKPAPGWLFREICQDAQQNPQDVPDLAEYLMRCVACDSRTVCLKACLTIRHLAEDILVFRQYMQKCPEALAMLKEVSTPPQLAQAASLERPEAKVAREAAARAWKSCMASTSVSQDTDAAHLKQRIQGFGNFEPPPPAEEQEPAPGARGLVDKVAGFVGDAVADTVDDFKEKGAVGAVRDGIADAADLILDGVGAVWDFLGGRKNKAPEVEERICRPLDQRGLAGPGMGALAGAGLPGTTAGAFTPQAQIPQYGGGTPAPPKPASNAFQGAFGQGAVGAGYAFSPDMLAQSSPAGAFAAQQQFQHPAAAAAAVPAPSLASASAPAPTPTPAPRAPPVDLMDFDDLPSPRSSQPSADLLSFDEGAEAGAAPGAGGGSPAAHAALLKNRGNDLVREKKFAEAVKAYEAALAALDGAGASEGEAALASLRATLHANIALCYLKQQLYRRAVEAATSGISADATHAKAYYRRCLAHRALKMYAEAKRDLDALQFCKHELSAAEMQKLQDSLAASMQTGVA